jgi:putative (di)nucleoside polyphosphate hydrolase
MARYDDLPYRTCVGITLINPRGLVFIGRRVGGPEHVDQTHVWQMPQGGVDSGEDTWAAAKRELYEETNARSVEKLGEVSDWLTYDIPRTVAGRAWKAASADRSKNGTRCVSPARTARSMSPLLPGIKRSSSTGAGSR